MVAVRRSLASCSIVFSCIVFCLASVSSAFGSATNVYITQNGSPSGNCTANVQTPAFFNNSGNWGNGSTQIGPGTTVLICGTFTGAAGATEFTFQGSGSSSSPVTLRFDTGAQLTSPFWSGNGAISCSNQRYVVVDGGTNGLIQNTANGTGLANHQTSTGVNASNCTNSEVKNLTVQNIYINEGSSSSASDTAGDNTAGIVFSGNSTSSIADNNTVSQAKTGIMFVADPNGDASNIQIYSNNIRDIDWGICIGGGDNGDTINNAIIHDNTITDWTNWQFPSGLYHQDGVILFNVGNPSAGLTATLYNNYIYGDLGVGSATGFIYCADFTTCTIYNNLLVNTGHNIYGMMWLGQSGNWGKNMYVYNNTVVGASASDVCIMLTISGKAVFENNVCTGPGGVGMYSTYLTSLASFAATISTSNHNVWNIGADGAWGSQANGATASYSAWQAYGFDAASTTGDPKLDGTYHLQSGSSATGLGANLTGLSIASLDLDKALNPRSSGTASWDAGVYNASSSSGAPAAPTGLAASVQ
jgi:hypothetical protein